MAQNLIKHGSEAGYRAELDAGNVCERCRNGHRVFSKQYTKTGKAKGLKYEKNQVIDHLYVSGSSIRNAGVRPGRTGPRRDQDRTRLDQPGKIPTGNQQDTRTTPIAGQGRSGPKQDFEPAETATGPTLADRIGEGLRNFVGRNDDYLTEDEAPDYLHEVEHDPEPDQEWAGPEGDEYVITKAGMVLIEDNLGTYLSVVGITLEMVDPYCGPILAENFSNIVSRWTKVIARYPRAAKLFMSKDGGTIFTWIGAIQATWPVLLAVYEHHLAKTVKTDNMGRIFRVASPSANGDNVDATMPPMRGYDYTVD